MKHYLRVAVTVIRPSWNPKGESIRQNLARNWDAAAVRPYWRIMCRWAERLALTALVVLAAPGSMSAAESRWYMDGPTAQRAYESIRADCYEKARSRMHNSNNTFDFGDAFSWCIQRPFVQIDKGTSRSYGVIVYGHRGGIDHYYLVWNAFDFPVAYDTAHKACREAGYNNCILRHGARNGCLAVARGYDQRGFGSGASKASAERVALRHCADALTCKVTMSKCNTKRYEYRSK